MDTGSPKQPHPLQYKISDQQQLGAASGSYVDYPPPQFDVYDNQASGAAPPASSAQQMQHIPGGPGPNQVPGAPPGRPPMPHHAAGPHPMSAQAGPHKPSSGDNGLIIREDGVAISSNGMPLDTSTLYGTLPPGAAHGHHPSMDPPPVMMMSGSPAPPNSAPMGVSNSSAAAAAAAVAIQRRNTKRKILHVASVPPPGSRVSPTPNDTNDDEPDTELRRAAVHSLRYPLERCAQHVREDEEGPVAEKSRQVFGMTWLLRACEKKKDGNVPRNRVYARYVTLCAELNLKPLNPAGFGKLVRIVFPEIKTRRLGVRGHSKYHYCGVCLVGNDANATGSTPNTSMVTRTPSPETTPGTQRAPSTTPMSAQYGDYSRQLFDYPASTSSPGAGPPGAVPPSTAPADVNGGHPPGSDPNSMNAYVHAAAAAAVSGGTGNTNSGVGPNQEHNLFAPTKFKPNGSSLEEFTVPRIGDYLSSEVDPDAATTLQALYTSHCRSLLDQLRYMHIKKFFSVINGFIRGLTAPVQRLLKQTDVIRWMADTDRRLYSEMILLLAPLVMQSLPQEVSQGLHALAASLPTQLENQGSQVCEEFVAAKKDAAAIFVDLVDRLLRANDAAQNASRILLNPVEVMKMKQDWSAYVTPVAAREAPCAQAAVVQILVQEIPTLLIEYKTEDASRMTINETLDPWAQYLGGLPKRVMHRLPLALFKTVCSAVATAALRDLNRGGCSSFGAWWVIRCWVDEYMAWQLELDSFLQPEKVQNGEPGTEVN